MAVEKFLSWLRPKYGVLFEVTNACNLHCPFCFVIQKNRMKNEFIPLERFEQILRTYRPLILQITGGEVSIHPHFIDLIKIASKYAIRTQISSNGLMLEQYIDDLIELPRKFAFGISLDAPNEVHDIIRNRKGLFKRVLETIKLFKKNRIPHSLHVVIFGKKDIPNLPEGNLHLVEKMLSFCQRYQLNANFQPYSPTQKEARATLGKILLESKSPYIINSIPYRKLLINGNWKTCRYNWTSISIDARGYRLPTMPGNCFFCSDCAKCYYSCVWEASLMTSTQFFQAVTGIVKPALSLYASNKESKYIKDIFK